MPISEKTRKILWARSGNLCAYCRRSLVVAGTENDLESVVGDECHIVSRANFGPRHDPSFATSEFDVFSNLILLCGTHHKMVDDQHQTHSTAYLIELKKKHEDWVEATLNKSGEVPTVKIRRFKQNVPQALNRVANGGQLLSSSVNCYGMYHYFADCLSGVAMKMIGEFFQSLKDYMDLMGDFEPIDYMQAVENFNQQFDELVECGFLIFSAVEHQQIEGGLLPSSRWPMLHVSVAPSNHPSVQHVETQTA